MRDFLRAAVFGALIACAVVGSGVVVLIAISIAYTGATCGRAPKTVKFSQGMTLCPGQSAVFEAPTPQPQGDGKE